MSSSDHGSLFPRFHQIREIGKHWGWYCLLGVLLIILGIAAISSSVYTTLISVFLLGVILLVGGVVQLVHSFFVGKWSGFFLSLLLGIFYIVAGFLCVAKPGISALSITLVIAALFLTEGLVRMISSIYLRFEHWGWVFFSGLINLVLGFLIFSDWPVSGLWVIGLFIGIDILLTGWLFVLLSLSARRLNR